MLPNADRLPHVLRFSSLLAKLLVCRFGDFEGFFILGSRMSDDWQYILVTCSRPHELDFRLMWTVNLARVLAVRYVSCYV